MQLLQFNVRFVQLALIVLKEQLNLLYVRLVAIVKLSGVFAKPVLPVFTVPKDLQTLENVWKVLIVPQVLQSLRLVRRGIIAKKVMLRLKSV